MNSDFKDLLDIFNAKQVKYLIVGGYAVIKYTQPRYTGDIDIWIEASAKNAENVYTALREFGAPVDTLCVADFCKEGFFYQMGLPPCRIDILMSITGVIFDQAWNNKTFSKIDGKSYNFISKEDLISAKKAAGRPKDLADLDSLLK